MSGGSSDDLSPLICRRPGLRFGSGSDPVECGHELHEVYKLQHCNGDGRHPDALVPSEDLGSVEGRYGQEVEHRQERVEVRQEQHGDDHRSVVERQTSDDPDGRQDDVHRRPCYADPSVGPVVEVAPDVHCAG